jgi:hypothetical protein
VLFKRAPTFGGVAHYQQRKKQSTLAHRKSSTLDHTQKITSSIKYSYIENFGLRKIVSKNNYIYLNTFHYKNPAFSYLRCFLKIALNFKKKKNFITKIALSFRNVDNYVYFVFFSTSWFNINVLKFSTLLTKLTLLSLTFSQNC